MESASTSSTFRFRDHQGMKDTTENLDTSSDNLSQSSDRDDELELQSMTGKGINHLCSELMELKNASDEDFHRNIISNYTVFVRIFGEAEGMENELNKLKSHVSTQKNLVKNLSIYLNILSEEMTNSIQEESECDEVSCLNEGEAHISDISETLDILISENKIGEALDLIEMEEENFQRLQFEGNYQSDVILSYKSLISETKTIITLNLTIMAENPRIAAAELQKAVASLCRLGDRHLASELLLRYYHSRIAAGIHNLQSSKSFLQDAYIRELVIFIFSMIAQAAKSFMRLHGHSPHSSELILWTCEEIQVFIAYFDKYVKSITHISGSLSKAVQAVNLAKSFCSLLESQRLVLEPQLIKLIRPCMEEVLQTHVDHCKKTIKFFTASDDWVLCRYLVSGILDDEYSAAVVGQQLEYCLLTDSGRKFLILLQGIVDKIYPLISLQMEGLVLGQLINLFHEYTIILRSVIFHGKIVEETDGSKLNLAESLHQQLSLLANLSTLETFLSGFIQSILKGISPVNSELLGNDLVSGYKKELDSYIIHIQENCDQVRAHFCQHFISNIMASEDGSILAPETCVNSQNDPMVLHAMPSVPFQVLFVELRKMQKIAEYNFFEMEWLMELFRELIENIFIWLSDSKGTFATIEGNETLRGSENFKQTILDVQFLVEVVKYGGYFSDYPLILTTLMKSGFLAVGLDPKGVSIDDLWARRAASEAIETLLKNEKTRLMTKEEPSYTLEEKAHEDKPFDFFLVDSSSSEDLGGTDSCEIADLEGSLDLMEVEGENAMVSARDEFQVTVQHNLSSVVFSERTVCDALETGMPIEEETSDEPNVNDSITLMKLSEGASTELPEDSMETLGQDGGEGEVSCKTNPSG